MKVKIWFLAAFLLVACDGFSLQADLENSEDVPVEDETQEVEDNFENEAETAQELEEDFDDEAETELEEIFEEEAETDQEFEENLEDKAETGLEDPSKRAKKPRRRRCPKSFKRKCFVFKYCYKRRKICFCVKRRKYGDEVPNDIQMNDENTEDEAEELEETTLEDPSKRPKKRRRRCPFYWRRKCIVIKRGKKKRRICFCVRPCYYKGRK